MQTAVLPLLVLAVIFAVPTSTGVTVPSSDTVATLLLLVSHVTVLGLGETFVVSFTPLLPFLNVSSVWSRVITVGFVTVTLHEDETPLLVCAVITALPSPTAVILPSDTLATKLLFVVHIMSL